MKTDEQLVDKYREVMGMNPRNLPEDHPDRWQWDYRGTPAERAALQQMMDPDPEVEYEQEELF